MCMYVGINKLVSPIILSQALFNYSFNQTAEVRTFCPVLAD